MITPVAPRWTERPPFNNAVNTVFASIGLAAAAFSLYMILSSIIKDRHNLMYQDNGIAGLICCYPFRVLDRRRTRKEAQREQRNGYLRSGEEPPLLLGGNISRRGADAVGRINQEGLDDSGNEFGMGLLRGDGMRPESIDITRI